MTEENALIKAADVAEGLDRPVYVLYVPETGLWRMFFGLWEQMTGEQRQAVGHIVIPKRAVFTHMRYVP